MQYWLKIKLRVKKNVMKENEADIIVLKKSIYANSMCAFGEWEFILCVYFFMPIILYLHIKLSIIERLRHRFFLLLLGCLGKMFTMFRFFYTIRNIARCSRHRKNILVRHIVFGKNIFTFHESTNNFLWKLKNAL